jgi:hypothetical protein
VLCNAIPSTHNLTNRYLRAPLPGTTAARYRNERIGTCPKLGSSHRPGIDICDSGTKSRALGQRYSSAGYPAVFSTPLARPCRWKLLFDDSLLSFLRESVAFKQLHPSDPETLRVHTLFELARYRCSGNLPAPARTSNVRFGQVCNFERISNLVRAISYVKLANLYVCRYDTVHTVVVS